MKRKIAALLAADVVGYSRLVAQAEEQAIARLIECQEVFRDVVERGGGRIFNTAGDAILAEFGSSVHALRAAMAIQETIRTHNLSYPIEQRMQFRIGMTVGDIIERGSDLLGGAVNVAARLEGLADPGGICLSKEVHGQVASKVPAFYRDIGLQKVKNIPTPVHAYKISFLDIEQIRDIIAPRQRRLGISMLVSMGGATLVVLVCFVVLWGFWRFQTVPKTTEARTEPAVTSPPSDPPAPAPEPVITAAAPDPAPASPTLGPPSQADISGYCRAFNLDAIIAVESAGLKELESYKLALLAGKARFDSALSPNDAARSFSYGLVFDGFYGDLVESLPAGSNSSNTKSGDIVTVIDQILKEERLLISVGRDERFSRPDSYFWNLQQGNCLSPDPMNPPTSDQMIRMIAAHDIALMYSRQGERLFTDIYHAVMSRSAEQRRRQVYWSIYRIVRNWRQGLVERVSALGQGEAR